MTRELFRRSSIRTTFFFAAVAAFSTACDGGGKSKGDLDAAADDAADGEGDSGSGNGGGGKGDGGAAGEGDDQASLCSGDCGDGNDCTQDDCVAKDVCTHTLDPSSCEAGFSCHPKKGCSKGRECATPADCADDDGCTVNERCGAALATCEYDPLDRDNDGFAPVACGGGDCNDADPRVGPGQVERCNGEDDNCNGSVDESAQCPGEGQVCKDAACVCGEGLSQCGRAGGCFDLQKDARHCGECGNDCGPAGVCNAGSCACPAPGAMCNGVCVDTSKSSSNCGACGTTCDSIPTESCIASTCTACGDAGEACCASGTGLATAGSGCRQGYACSGERGVKGSICECAGSSKVCGESCVDVTSSNGNCGACGTACGLREACVASSCTACGEVGMPCCNLRGIRYCGSVPGGGGGPGNDATCNQETLKCDPA